ncbi:MAG: AMP-binding protein [Acidimicrobiia bacterium]
MGTIAELLQKRAGDPHTAYVFEGRTWTYDEYVRACGQRARYLLDTRRPGPFHVGVLLDNTPEFATWLGAAAVAGAVVVGINPTRRGAELARDINFTDCQWIVTEASYEPLLEGLDLGAAGDRRLVVDSGARYTDLLEQYAGGGLPDVEVDDSTLFLLLFTSGTSGAPKACLCSQGRLARMSGVLAEMLPLTADDVCYQSMPLFHSNALITGWTPCLAVGATGVLRRRFSASGFLPDVRAHGVTYFNYVGKPLSYILATPEQPDDADNTLRVAFGNEAADLDIERFERRFGCKVIDGYGSTEGGAHIGRTPDMPKGALGMAGEGVVVLDPDTGEECPRARFDDEGRLVNPDEAIGEIVNTQGAAGFEGYYKNDEANAARVREGLYWTGDLGYRDEVGYFYFAGRDFEWLRVDGENFAAAPVERILARQPDVVLAAVYAVPDPDVGDRVMAALQLRPGASFDPEGFVAFLAAQPDLGTKWAPRFVRVSEALPVTETSKVLKRVLRRERWECDDPVWWQPEKGAPYRRLEPADADGLRDAFASRGRLAALNVS